MYTLPSQPVSFFSIFGHSLSLYKKAFVKLLPFTILYAIIIIIPNIVYHYSLFQAWSAIPNFHWAFLVFQFICEVIGMLFMLAIFHQAYQVMLSTHEGEWKSFTVALRKLFIVVIASILYILIVAICSVFLLLPGIFVGILLSFYTLRILIENDGIGAAYSNSAKLVLGNWWRSFFVLLIPIAVLVVLFAFFEVVFGIPVAMLVRYSHHEIKPISHFVLFILMIFVYPWVSCVSVTYYHDLKLRLLQKV